ncbi:MAG: hypothetical protein ABR555_02010 [Pyrinomonadaceae bacterium]
MKNSDTQDKMNERGWNPDSKTGEDALKTEERSLDIGESGQFAPGGYYNQQRLNEPGRSTDEIVPPRRGAQER